MIALDDPERHLPAHQGRRAESVAQGMERRVFDARGDGGGPELPQRPAGRTAAGPRSPAPDPGEDPCAPVRVTHPASSSPRASGTGTVLAPPLGLEAMPPRVDHQLGRHPLRHQVDPVGVLELAQASPCERR